MGETGHDSGILSPCPSLLLGGLGQFLLLRTSHACHLLPTHPFTPPSLFAMPLPFCPYLNTGHRQWAGMAGICVLRMDKADGRTLHAALQATPFRAHFGIARCCHHLLFMRSFPFFLLLLCLLLRARARFRVAWRITAWHGVVPHIRYADMDA